MTNEREGGPPPLHIPARGVIEKRHPVAMKLDAKLVAELDAYAKSKGMDRTALVHQLLAYGLAAAKSADAANLAAMKRKK